MPRNIFLSFFHFTIQHIHAHKQLENNSNHNFNPSNAFDPRGLCCVMITIRIQSLIFLNEKTFFLEKKLCLVTDSQQIETYGQNLQIRIFSMSNSKSIATQTC